MAMRGSRAALPPIRASLGPTSRIKSCAAAGTRARAWRRSPRNSGAAPAASKPASCASASCPTARPRGRGHERITRTRTMSIPNIRLPALDFDLGQDAEMLRDTVSSFAAKEIAPRAADIDRENEFPNDLWKKMGDIGILGVTVE